MRKIALEIAAEIIAGNLPTRDALPGQPKRSTNRGMDLVHESTPPLAWDHEQMPFQVPSEAIAWKVRIFTGKPGRPPGVYGEHGILHLGLDANVMDLRRAVQNKPGSYRLYPVDSAGKELAPIGCMEIVASDEPEETALDLVAAEGPATTAAMRELVVLCNKMVASRDSHDALLANVLSTLVSTTATIQRSTAAVLNAASTTIKVANGVESLERQEPPDPLDVNELSQQLADALTPAASNKEDSKPTTPWFIQLLNGPVGMAIMSNVNSFLSVIREQHVAQQKAAQAPPPQPAPPPQARPAPPQPPAQQASAPRPPSNPPPASSAPPEYDEAPPFSDGDLDDS